MTAPVAADGGRLALATAIAAVVAAVVLVVAVLPAEYGIDPTGLGAATGFARLNEEAPSGVIVEAPGDAEPASLYEMRATWRLVSVPIAEQAGNVSRADREAQVKVPIAIPNLTSVTAQLSWDDADRIGGQPTEGDTLEISIRAPGGERSQLVRVTNEPGKPGAANVTLSLLSVPFPREDDPGGLVFPTAEDASGIGNWTFVVRLYGAGGVNGSDEADPGNAWTLRVVGEAYDLEVRKQTERFGDRVRLTLAPGRGVEYKFGMDEGAQIAYRWTADVPVHVELHADRPEAPEEVTTFEVAKLDSGEGTHVAPFKGRHGWYWRNDGATPVTITLETTGDYEILGAVG